MDYEPAYIKHRHQIKKRWTGISPCWYSDMPFHSDAVGTEFDVWNSGYDSECQGTAWHEWDPGFCPGTTWPQKATFDPRHCQEYPNPAKLSSLAKPSLRLKVDLNLTCLGREWIELLILENRYYLTQLNIPYVWISIPLILLIYNLGATCVCPHDGDLRTNVLEQVSASCSSRDES